MKKHIALCNTTFGKVSLANLLVKQKENGMICITYIPYTAEIVK